MHGYLLLLLCWPCCLFVILGIKLGDIFVDARRVAAPCKAVVCVPVLRSYADDAKFLRCLSVRPLTLYRESMQAVLWAILYCSCETWTYQTRNRFKNWSFALFNSSNRVSPKATWHCVSVRCVAGRSAAVVVIDMSYRLWMIKCCLIYY